MTHRFRKFAAATVLCFVAVATLTLAPAAPSDAADDWSYIVTYAVVVDPAHYGAHITNYHGTSATPAVPSSLGGYPVIALGAAMTWSGSTPITGLTLPSTLLAVGSDALKGQTSLKTVSLPANLEEIGYNSFENTGLTSITIPAKVSVLRDAVFKGVTSLTNITFASGIDTTTSVPISFCEGCTSLKTISMPGTFGTIGENAFKNSGLTGTVTLPSGFTAVASTAFTGTNLDAIAVPPTLWSFDLSAATQVRPGYSFAGWGTTPYLASNVTSASSFYGVGGTLYSLWSVNLTHNANGGTLAGSSQVVTTVSTSQPVTAPSTTPVLALHRFKYWSDALNGSSGAVTWWGSALNANRTVYAQWDTRTTASTNSVVAGEALTMTGTGFATGETVTMTLHPGNGLLGSAVADASGNISLVRTLPTSLPVGAYTVAFAGSITGSSTEAVAVTNYVASFNAAGGSPTPANVNAYSGLRLVAPAEPTRSLHRFLGWFRSGTVWNFATGTVASDTTLTAQWQARGTVSTNSVVAGEGLSITGTGFATGETVTMTLQPGNVSLGSDVADASGNISLVKTVPTSVAAGSYTVRFAGSVTGTSTEAITVLNYVVSFNAAGGAPAPAAVNAYSGLKLAAPTEPTWALHRFLGWFRSGTAWNFATGTVTSNTTLTAQWESRATSTGDVVAVGDELAVAGTGFASGETVSLSLAETGTALGALTADAAGAIEGVVTIPLGVAAGAHSITFSGALTGVSVGPATIAVVKPHLVVTPNAGVRESDSVDFIITGVAPNGAVDVQLGGVAIASGTAANDGTLTLSNYRIVTSGDLEFTAIDLATGARSVAVVPVNVASAPALTVAGSALVVGGAIDGFSITASGYPTPVITSVIGLPTGIVVDGSTTEGITASATLDGVAAEGTWGNHLVTVTGWNWKGITTETFTVTVADPGIEISPNQGVRESDTVTLALSGLTPSGNATIVKDGVELIIVSADTNGEASTTDRVTVAGVHTYRVVDGSTTATFEEAIMVAAATSPSITATGDALAVGDSIGEVSVSATGYPAPTLDSITGLPEGLTFDGFTVDGETATATLSGTVASGSAGTHSVEVTASNWKGVSTQRFTITVAEPAVTFSPDSGVRETDTVTLALTGLTPNGGVTVTKDSAELAVLTADDNGEASTTDRVMVAGAHTYGVSDATTGATGEAVLTVAAATAPSITASADALAAGDGPGTISVTATGYPSPTLDSIAGLPEGLTFDGFTVDGETATATLSGTVASGSAGTYSVEVTASNWKGLSTGRFTITVAEPMMSVTPSTGVRETDTVTILLSGLTPGGPVIVSKDGSELTTLTADVDGLATTTEVVTAAGEHVYMAVDVATGATAQADLSVAPAQAPELHLTNAAMAVGGSASAIVIRAEGYPSPSIDSVTGLPAGLIFDGFSVEGETSTAALSGAVTALVGTYTVEVVAANAKGTATETFTITVASPEMTGTPGDGLRESDKVDLSLTGLTPGGSASVSQNGSNFATVTADAQGAAAIVGRQLVTSGDVTFTVVDDITGATGSLVVTVGVSTAPVVVATGKSLAAGSPGTSLTITATGYPAPSIDSLSGLPAGLSFDGFTTDRETTTAILSGAVSPGTAGSYNVKVETSNWKGTASMGLTITVAQPALAVSPGTTVVEKDAITFTASAMTPVGQASLTRDGIPVATVTVSSTGVASFDTKAPAAGHPRYTVVDVATGASASLAVVSDAATTPSVSVSDLIVVEGGEVEFAVVATGLPTPAVAVTGLPRGLSVCGMQLVRGVATATICGRSASGSAGGHSVTVTATNWAGTGAETFTIDTNVAPTIDASSTTVATHTEFLWTLRASGWPLPAITVDGLPEGVTTCDTLSSGVTTLVDLCGIVPKSGVYDVTVTAASALGTVSEELALTVTAVPRITVADVNIVAGNAVAIDVAAVGYPAPEVTIDGLPDGLSWDGVQIVGMVNRVEVGDHEVTVTATNTISTVVEAFTITVRTAAPVAPSVDGSDLDPSLETGIDAPDIAMRGENIDVTIEGLDADVMYLDVWLFSTPVLISSGATLAADGTLTVTIPVDMLTGSHHIAVTASDTNELIGWRMIEITEAPVAISTPSVTAPETPAVIITPVPEALTEAPAPETSVSASPTEAAPNPGAQAPLQVDPPRPADSAVLEEGGSFSWWLVLGIIVLVIAGGVAAFWFFKQRRKSSEVERLELPLDAREWLSKSGRDSNKVE